MRNEIRNIYKKRAIDSRLNMLGDSYETSSINAYQSNIDQSSKHHSHLETIINNWIVKKRERNLRENIALSARLELALNKNKYFCKILCLGILKTIIKAQYFKIQTHWIPIPEVTYFDI